jgi:hypothetical protein
VVQSGSTVARVIPRVTRPGCRITDILDTVSRSVSVHMCSCALCTGIPQVL